MLRSPVLQFTPPGLVELREIELPVPGENELVVETLFSAVSPGTENRCLSGHQTGVMLSPCVPGYQAVGRVVTPDAAGTFVEGDCVFFARGRTPDNLVSFCGTHAARAVVPTENAVPMANPGDLAAASMAKITAIARHGIELANIQPHESVAVIGLGLLGQISTRLAGRKTNQVHALDRQYSRVNMARNSAAHALVAAETLAQTKGLPADGFDVVIDATGVPAVIAAALPLCRELMPWNNPVHRGSRYVIQGSYPGSFELSYDELFRREIQLFVSRDSTHADLQEALQLIESDPEPYRKLMGEVVSPADARSVYEGLASGHASRQTAVFDWSQI